MEEIQQKISIQDNLLLDTQPSYTSIKSTFYFPKLRLACFLIRHNPIPAAEFLKHDANKQNVVLKIYDIPSLTLKKSVTFPHFYRLEQYNEEQLALYQTKLWGPQYDDNPSFQIFDMKTLSVIGDFIIPIETVRGPFYQRFEHTKDCTCYPRDDEIVLAKSACGMVIYPNVKKQQFSKFIKAGQDEFIFSLYSPDNKYDEPRNNAYQIWNPQTRKIRHTTYQDMVQDGQNQIKIKQSSSIYAYNQAIQCNQSKLWYNLIQVQEDDGKEQQPNQISIALVQFQQTGIKTIRTFRTSKSIDNLVEKKTVFFVNENQKYMAVITGKNEIDVFDFQSSQLLSSIKYPEKVFIDNICFKGDDVIVSGIEYHFTRLKFHQKSFQAYYAHIFQNNIQTGYRINRFLQVFDQFEQRQLELVETNLKLQCKLLEISNNTIVATYNQEAKEYISIMYSYKLNQQNEQEKQQLQEFRDWKDNGIDWHNNYLCACGKYLQPADQRALIQGIKQQDKGYFVNPNKDLDVYTPKKCQCHNCDSKSVYWACNDCLYSICKKCRKPEMADQDELPSIKKCMNDHDFKQELIDSDQDEDDQIKCKKCRRNITTKFYYLCENYDSQLCLVCNEPESWAQFRKEELNKLEAKKNEEQKKCMRCGSNKSQYIYEQDDKIFCACCALEGYEDLVVVDQKSLKGICFKGHQLKFQKYHKDDEQSCPLCENSSQVIKDQNFVFSCQECEIYMCQTHAPFYKDMVLCGNGDQLALKQVDNKQKLNCMGCDKKITGSGYLCTGDGCENHNVCSECLQYKPRFKYQSEYIDQYKKNNGQVEESLLDELKQKYGEELEQLEKPKVRAKKKPKKPNNNGMGLFDSEY